MILDDTANTVGSVGYVDSKWIGARPNDTLIGNRRYGLEIHQFATGTLNLGSGADTINLTQRPTGGDGIQWTVNGGGQPVGSSDRLIAGTTGYVVDAGSGAAPNGFVSSQSEYGRLSYAGMESVTIDGAWAQILSSSFDRTSARPAVVVQMNNVEVMPLALDGQQGFEDSRRAPYRVRNLTTNSDIPYSQLRAVVDNATHTIRIEYLGSAQGIFPDGKYACYFGYYAIRTASGGILLFDTNSPPYVVAEVDFRSLAGDANGDGIVNFSDLLTLSQNFRQSPRNFSQGDFNYDGNVDFADLLILSQKFGTSLSVVTNVFATPGAVPSLKGRRGHDFLD